MLEVASSNFPLISMQMIAARGERSKAIPLTLTGKVKNIVEIEIPVIFKAGSPPGWESRA
jgi:hypothetical protein